MEACGSYRNRRCGKQETWTTNLVNTSCNDCSSWSTSKDEDKILEVG